MHLATRHFPAPACHARRVRRSLVALAMLCALPLQALAQTADAGADNGKPCGLDAATRERVAALVRAIAERGHAPGAVADIRCAGQPWLLLAIGKADTARERPMRQDDLFRIYSMTKPVTALAVLMLAEDGRLGIDDPVARHLPEFASAQVFVSEDAGALKTEPPRRPLTVRDLLRHSAGIPYMSPLPHAVVKRYVERGIDHGGGPVVKPTDGGAPVDSAADLSRRIAGVPLLHHPGERFSYGNSSDVLGRLVEAVSGKRLGVFLNERLFGKLGMTDTAFIVDAAKLPRLTAAYAGASQRPSDGGTLNGQRVSDLGPSKLSLADDPQNSVFARPRALDFGGAGLVSTAADYQRLLALLLAGGEVPGASGSQSSGQSGGQRLLRADTVAAFARNQLDAAALKASPSLDRNGLGYGLGVGVFLDPARSPGGVPKDGYFWGGAASTYFWVDPARRITGVLMTQVFGGDVSPYFVDTMDSIYRRPQ